VPTITGYILLFFTAAIIFHEEKSFIKGKVNLIYQNLLIDLYVILAALAIFVTVQFFRPWQADLLLQEALTQNNALARADGIASAIIKWPYREFLGELYKTEKFIVEQSREKDETIYLKYKNDAEKTVDELLKNYGNYYSTQIIAADYYAVINDETQMTWFYEKAVNLAPTRHNIYWFWGDSLLKLNKKDEALAKYQEAIDIDPSLEYPRQKMEEFKFRVESLK
jgi:tetratricopeptide (TPR) repeat protein